MATRPSNLIDFVNQPRDTAEFIPYAYYGAEEDALKVYFKPDADYARRINSRVTIYYSIDSHDLVGVQVKNVRQVLDDLGSFDISIQHDGKERLRMLFVAYHADFAEGDELRKVFRDIGRNVAESQIAFDLTEYAEVMLGPRFDQAAVRLPSRGGTST